MRIYTMSTLLRHHEYGAEVDGYYKTVSRAVEDLPDDPTEVETGPLITVAYYGITAAEVDTIKKEHNRFWWYRLPDAARIIYIEPLEVIE